ncbi:hypothetical protein FBZ89_105185 [Nitrospirillum amazonense]|uniref:Uncharacterized protein n=1 Tax=Nitrospirillum amazonense TaxID=28077 RepID=A0A560FI77_9PROT|nr:hypothetical protein [Nitrospirillum amazonense]TWB21313.1 hypothetical protein FBZ89_105185 [Nitrospirillum amazonense]
MLTVASLPRVEIARLRRPALQASGWLVMGLGVLSLPIPGPVSTPLLAVGGLMVLRSSVSARRHYVRARDHAPRLVRPLFGRFDAWRHRHRTAQGAPVRVPAKVLAAANDVAANDQGELAAMTVAGNA